MKRSDQDIVIKTRFPENLLLCLAFTFIISGCDEHKKNAKITIQPIVINSFKSDSEISTQCISFEASDQIWMTSGGAPESLIIQKYLSTDQLRTWRVNDFTEGCTIWDKHLFVLTWQTRRVLRFSLEEERWLSPKIISSEGWGMARSSEGSIVYSDGSSQLRWIEPRSLLSDQEDLIILRESAVRTEAGELIYQLNELEFFDHWLLANIYPTDQIAIIDPLSVKVIAWLDLSELRAQLPRTAGVLNGIGYDPSEDRLLITGKKWDRLYQLDTLHLRSLLRSF